MVPVLGSAEAGNRLGIMAGALGEPASYGAKLLSLFPDNPRHGRSSHSGVIVIFDPGTGLPLGCLDAAEITAMRTAAASAVATQVLARADATVLAILGCGEQAGVHVAAMRAVRPIGRVLVWGRDAERTAVFARRHGAEIAGSVAEAVAPADIVCTTTPAAVPFLTADMLHAGLHVNAAGASIPTTQEIATEVVPRVRLVTDYRPSLEAQAAEVIAARRLGLIGEDFPIAEIGEVLDGGAAGRQDAEEVTLYRSLGVVAQDLAAACFILERAAAAGRGVVVDWG
jgi:ornithine cyclodeaminase